MNTRSILIAVFLSSLSLSAQTINDYIFSTHMTGSLENMSSETTPLLTTGVYHDNDASPVTDIGFAFKFGDTVYNQLSANSNGQFRFGTTVVNNWPASYATGLALLAPMNSDNAIWSTGKLHYKLVGTSPDRRLVVEWDKIVIPASSSPSNYTFGSFQIWLYESTNEIKFVYGAMVVNSPSSLYLGARQWYLPTAWSNVMVTNDGGGSLILSAADISLTGSGASQFEIDYSALPISLSCAQSMLIPVRMIVSVEGWINANLGISYGSQIYEVALSGLGLQEGVICIGEGNQDYGLPLDTAYGYNYTQTLYLSSELNVENKQIEKIWYYWTNGVDASTAENWIVYMGLVSWEEFPFSNWWVPWYDLTEVFNGSVDLNSGSNWVEITLDTPFGYNSAYDLVIAVDENTGGYVTGLTSDFWCTASTTNRGIKYSNDSFNPDYTNPPNGTLVRGYPDIRLLLADIPVLLASQLTYPADEAINLPLQGFDFSGDPDPESVPVDSYTLVVSNTNSSQSAFFSSPYYYTNTSSPTAPIDIPFELGQTWFWNVTSHTAGFPDTYAWPPHEFRIEDYPYIYLPHSETVDLQEYPQNWTQTYDGTLVYGPWGVPATNIAGGEACEFRCDWYWGVSGTGRLISPPIFTGDLDILRVSFKYAFESLGVYAFPSLKYSHDLVNWFDTTWQGPGVYGGSSGVANVYLRELDSPVTWLGWTMSGDYLSFHFWWLDDFVITEAALAGPLNIAISRQDGETVLTWTAAPGASTYNIYRALEPYPIDWGSPVDNTSDTTWTEPNSTGNSGFYRVSAEY